MIVRLVRLTFSPQSVDAFDALYAQFEARIHARPGCRMVRAMRVPDEPCQRATLSLWDAQEDLDAYRESALFGEVWPATKALFDAPPEAQSYELNGDVPGVIFDA